MNNREIDALIAEKVMGWNKKDKKAGEFSKWFDGDKFICHAVAWYPTISLEKAWQVVEKLETLGYWAQLRTPFDKGENDSYYWCGFTPHLTTGWNGRPDHWTNAPTITMAICLAALKCVGV